MSSSAIDLFVEKFNKADALNETEFALVRETNKFSFIHFNGEIFAKGFNRELNTFLVTNYQQRELLKLSDNWELNSSLVGDDLFRSIQYKLTFNYRLFFDFHKNKLAKKPESIIIDTIVREFLARQKDNMATEEEILKEIRKFYPTKNMRLRELGQKKILPRLCAGKNESMKYSYFYNDGTVEDISLIDTNMSMSKYIDYLLDKFDKYLGLTDVAKNYYLMYHGFKVHTLISIWHKKFGYNLSYEISGYKSNLIFEKHIFSLMSDAFENSNNYFYLSEQIINLHKDNSILWLLKNIFKNSSPENSKILFTFKYTWEDRKLTLFGLSDLVVVIPFLFKSLFFKWDEIVCVGSNSEFELTKYKQIFTIKHTYL